MLIPLARTQAIRLASGNVAHESALQQALGELGSNVHGLHPQLLDEASVSHMVEDVVARFGRIHALVHLVGGVPVAETTLAQWEHMIRLNLLSTFLCCRHVVPVMMRQNSG
ncbi:MAG: SDR family NAD(P)-dependent oxidoreductase, partial [candidate division KSB1 bacterium]|nr:SDR family NAD(P)-dependent oxidoreductase [candidate division KSB1 bacterium]